MDGFLKDVAERIYHQHGGYENMVFIFPNKRAGLFFKQQLAKQVGKGMLVPSIVSIEAFLKDLSGLHLATKANLLLELYEVFAPRLAKEESQFETFMGWGSTLLTDFNDIDHNMVASDKLFSYLTEDQRIKAWGSNKEASPLLASTLKFWGQLNSVYQSYRKKLLQKGFAYQGMLYREAIAKCATYLKTNTHLTHHFIGFNALTTAEELLFQTFIDQGASHIWWDIHTDYLKDSIHEAGFFIRSYLKNWPQGNVISKTGTAISSKNINIYGVPKSISQAKLVGHLLTPQENTSDSSETAIILSDESLLQPILNVIPSTFSKVNITMGLPLKQSALYGFFEALFTLHSQKLEQGYFHKDVLRLFSNPYTYHLFTMGGLHPTELADYIKANNLLFVTYQDIGSPPFSGHSIVQDLLSMNAHDGLSFIALCKRLITILQHGFHLNESPLDHHQLYTFHTLFNQLGDILSNKPYVNSLSGLRILFNELTQSETTNFIGEPLGGLQLMGLLETRNLDFKTVILTSVNEGILPGGKTSSSFIPFSIRKAFGLPTYKEKDALYAYHFYRILQRAENIHIIYNTETDVLLGNEKSRFITQLLTNTKISKEAIHHTITSPKSTVALTGPKTIRKSPDLIRLLQNSASRGFSPSSLSTYIKDPYEFYKKNVLRLQDADQVEESIAHNTFGTIVHDSLELLYKPLIGQRLTIENLNELLPKVQESTFLQFEKHFPKNAISIGENLIAYHAIQKYIASVIQMDIVRSKSSDISLVALEKDLSLDLTIPHLGIPVRMKGKLDRLERNDGTLQILDYKTGNVTRSEVELTNLEESTSSDKCSKAFQLLCYALMLHKNHPENHLMAAIVPIKNLTAGILHFAKKKGARAPKNIAIDMELLEQFEVLLMQLISEILNPERPFKEADQSLP